MKIRKVLPYIILGLAGIISALYFVAYLDSVLLKTKLGSFHILAVILYVASRKNARKLFFILFAALVMAITVLILQDSKDYQSAQIVVTPKISTPVPAGQGQCGTAKWLDKKTYDTVFSHFTLDKKNALLELITPVILNDIKLELNRIIDLESQIEELSKKSNRSGETAEQALAELELKQHELEDETKIIREISNPKIYDDIKEKIQKGEFDSVLLKESGIVLGKKDISELEELIYYIKQDIHTLILGATRSGKSRTIVLQTICSLAMAGESIVVTDPKSELYDYTCKLLELLGYDIVTIDFKNPSKSTRFNFLQPIINCIDADDLPGAIDATWDLVSQLVGEPKGERLWNDGEASMIAAGTMAVVYDNRAPENHKYRNLANVYYFISQMCTPVQVGNAQVLPLNKYVQDLPMDHPSKGLLAVSEIAPSRTRGSFYTSALMTLRLFTNPLIADMTSHSDYDAMKVGSKKTAVFIILPDDRKTYYSLASLYVTQQYQMLSKAADLRGGRLKLRVNYILDEFGNFVKIPICTNMLTVGGGKGIRFYLFVQDFNQIDVVYDEKEASIIRSNCENWIYLQTDDPNTLKSLSDKLGKYTISTYSLSANHQKFSNPSSSHNVSLTGRELLTPDEIKRVNRPYSLVTSRNDPAIFYSPDLSQWYFNNLLGLGDEEHNRRIRLARENVRPFRKVSNKIVLWGIWDEYKSAILKEQKDKELKAKQEMVEQMMAASSQFYNP